MSAGMTTALLLAGAWSSIAAADAFQCVSPVQSISHRDKMTAGDFSANGHWREVRLSPHSIGYGPAAQREYELTIADGKVTMARPVDDKVEVRHDPRPDEGFAMLQVASPESWMEAGELALIGSFDDLNFELDQLAEENGCGDDVLLPFRITGHARSVTWSLDTAPQHKVTETRDQDVVVVGIYNRNAKTTYFMVPGYNIHAHMVMPALDLAGHVRTLELEAGARLSLPGPVQD